MGRQEKMVMEAWYSEKPCSVNIARKKWTEMESDDRTSPTSPTHFNFDFIPAFPSPFISVLFRSLSQPPSSILSVSLSLLLSRSNLPVSGYNQILLSLPMSGRAGA